MGGSRGIVRATGTVTYGGAGPSGPKPSTADESAVVERWIVANVDACDVPADEGNSDALIYNLVMLARHGRPYRRYEYAADQDAEVASWKA